MDSQKYWVDRAADRVKAYHGSYDNHIYKLIQAHEKAINNITSETNKILSTMAKRGGISKAQAEKLLKSQYITYDYVNALKNSLPGVQDERIRQQMLNEINALAYKARISRHEQLQHNIRLELMRLSDYEIRADTAILRGVFKQAYNLCMFNIHKGIGFYFAFAQVPKSRIDAILKLKWSGKHYSERVWKNNVHVLGDKLMDALLEGFATGKSSYRIAQDFAHLSDLGAHAAQRLIRTEMSFIANSAELESYTEAGLEACIFVATLDLKTSKTCQAMDGATIKLAEAVIGENIPPLHPWCRSTTIAYISKEDLAKLKRIARDPVTGKTYHVPADMTYKAWEDQFIKG